MSFLRPCSPRKKKGSELFVLESGLGLRVEGMLNAKPHIKPQTAQGLGTSQEAHPSPAKKKRIPQPQIRIPRLRLDPTSLYPYLVPKDKPCQKWAQCQL